MFRVTREIDFCYGHRLLNYAGKCRYLHGHNGRAIITLEAARLDALGMVVDFSRIKQAIQGWIEEALDHKMLLHKDDPLQKTWRRFSIQFRESLQAHLPRHRERQHCYLLDGRGNARPRMGPARVVGGQQQKLPSFRRRGGSRFG